MKIDREIQKEAVTRLARLTDGTSSVSLDEDGRLVIVPACVVPAENLQEFAETLLWVTDPDSKLDE